MFPFLFRMVLRAATVQRYKFIALTLTLAVASALLVILSSLYLNAKSQLKLELSGVPNFVVEPQKSIVNLTRLTSEDVAKLKSTDHFWRNNVINAVPMQQGQATLNGKDVETAGTWFQRLIEVEGETYPFGILKFKGWQYSGDQPDDQSVILGSALKGDLKTGQEVEVQIGSTTQTFPVAGFLETGSFWDNYVFLDLKVSQQFTGREALDQILISGLIKPKDELALKAEVYGPESLTPEEYEAWYCSPYASSIAYTIEEVIPQGRVRTLRRITEVQEGIIRSSGGVFGALFVVTLVVAVLAIFSAEKMYLTSKVKDFAILAALGASRQKSFIQLMLEISLASFFSMVLSYLAGKMLVARINAAVFGVKFTAEGTLLITSATLPLALAMVTALILVKKTFERNVMEILR